MTPREIALNNQPRQRELIQLLGEKVGLIEESPGFFVCVRPLACKNPQAVIGQTFHYKGKVWRIVEDLSPRASLRAPAQDQRYLKFRAQRA